MALVPHKIAKLVIAFAGFLGFISIFLPYFEMGYTVSFSAGDWDYYDQDDQCPTDCTDWDLGDGICDSVCNSKECNYDDGDCSQCTASCPNAFKGDGECDVGCNIAACNYDDGDCPGRALSQSAPKGPKELKARPQAAVPAQTGPTVASNIQGYVKALLTLTDTQGSSAKMMREQLRKLSLKAAQRRGAKAGAGRSLAGDEDYDKEDYETWSSVHVSFALFTGGCTIEIYHDDEDVTDDMSAEDQRDFDEAEAGCSAAVQILSLYLAVLVPWAAIGSGFAVAAFWKAASAQCGCNCDNFKCCPINSMIFSIVHLCIIAFVAGLINSMAQELYVSSESNEDFGYEAYFNNGAGLILSILSYIITITAASTLICCIKGEVKEEAPAGPMVATAVMATAVPVGQR